MTQKVIKIGSSLGVTIPAKQLLELGISKGDEIEVYIGNKSKEYLRHEKLLKELEEFTKIYGPALKNLANR